MQIFYKPISNSRKIKGEKVLDSACVGQVCRVSVMFVGRQ